MKKTIFLLVMIFQLCVFSACASELNIVGDNELFIGDNIQLSVEGNIKNYSWGSSDNDIAIVSDGIVTGVSSGNVYIYLEKNKKIVAKYNIKVKTYVPESIEIVNILESYDIGETSYTLRARAYPEYSNQDFIWEGGGSKAIINKETGEITFLEEGDVYIVCRSKLDPTVFKGMKLVSKYPKDVEVINVLFIGNSLTYVNDVPGMVRKIAVASGKAINCDSITAGGNTLRDILTKQEYHIKRTLSNRKYDYIIIQEASAANYLNYEGFLSAARDFKSLADENKAELILYQTWAYSGIENSHAQQQAIINSYANVANELNVRINPVGEIFFNFSVNYPDINLYQDMNHASLAGSYLASCVHYVCLFNDSVINNSFKVDLDESTIYAIQNYVSSYLIEIN